MNGISTKAKKLATTLLRENRRGRSYRTIAREDYKDKIDQSTLSRIARNKGTWLPKDRKILAVLGLLPAPKPKKIFDMAPNELLWRLQHRK